MAVRLFGVLETDLGARTARPGTPRQRALLAVLALEPGRVVPRDRLVAAVWEDAAPPSATATLQAHVSQLRRALEPDRAPRAEPRLLLTREPGYLLALRPDQVDLGAFEALAEDGRRALRGGARAEARALLDRALALWRGEPLAEFAGLAFAQPVRTRFGELRATALEHRMEAALDLGESAACVADLERLVAEHPYRERLWALLVLALYRTGRQADALAALRRVRALLAEELALEPGLDLRDLERAVFEQSPALDAPAPPSVPVSPGHASPAAAPAGPPPGASDPGAAGSGTTGPGVEGSRIDVPGAGAAGGVFVGRVPELRRCAELLAEARRGRGGVVLLSGAAGVGKTRLARAIAAEAEALGLPTAWGRCAEDTGAPAFWPWLQVLGDLGARDAELMLAGRDGTVREPFALHSAAVAALATGPAKVIVLDDLHWADAASLRLLAFAAADLHRLPLVVVATLRLEPGAAPEQLGDALGVLAREDRVTRIDVPPLTVAEVGAFLAAHGAPGGRRVEVRLHERTGGNPFYLGELLRLPVSERWVGDGVPVTVREVIARRVARLPAGTGALLRCAAVLGREFSPEHLAAASGASAADVLDRLQPAVEVGLLTEAPDGFDYGFAHPLVRDALYSGLSRLDRSRLHLRVGEAIEAAAGMDRTVRLPALAHHYGMAAPVGGAAKAVEFAVLAARQATAQNAHDEAAAHWRRALAALGTADPARRGALLVELAASHQARGDATGARAALNDAIDLAGQAGDREILVAALGVSGGHSQWLFRDYGESDDRTIALLKAALSGPLPDARRAELLGTLAQELHYSGRSAEGGPLAAEAVATARRTGDPALLARTLNNLVLVLYVPGREAERLAALTEMLALPGLVGAAEAVARVFLATELVRGGDLPGCRRELARAAQIGTATRDRTVQGMGRVAETALAVLEGRWGDVEALIDDYSALLADSTLWGLEFCRWNALLSCHEAWGTVGELLPGLLEAAERIEPLRPVAVLAALDAGDEATARALVTRWGAVIRPVWTQCYLTAVWGEVAARLGTPDPGELYRRLLPHGDELIIAGIGITARGSVHRVLAELAAAMGEPRTARAHAERARLVHARLGLPHWERESAALLDRLRDPVGL
ncbi:AfsR/SARP family transcriptional regulator [Actinocorallia herbida]|uniref:AfsR/SARP family transcriptional regulator n=1 Tax=Actinocorallia herbida TaxID=58109 RepID=UPI001476A4B1|nr:AfsR/SARP family transcriptional regulator [Actinocorallia herbida]